MQNKIARFFRVESDRNRIVFSCDFHGITGSTIAIAGIANLLAAKYRVDFVADIFSNFNPMLRKEVVIISPEDMDKNRYDLYVCDGHTDLPLFYRLAEQNKKCLISIHGILRKENNLEKVYLATKSHLVSEAQFMHHEVEKSRYFVIPNYCGKIGKTSRTYNVGIVGRVDDLNKNVAEALVIAKLSDASETHLWGGAETKRDDNRVVYHAWSRDKNRVYDSFDVLISMSREESMGLTVIEAMSCGIPCVLSDIPGFRIYKNCPGIALVPIGNRGEAVEYINRFLKTKSQLKADMIEYWDRNYSERAVAEMWFKEIEALVS
ncbi:MAG: glycosyltransferase [Sulfuriferula sp.]